MLSERDAPKEENASAHRLGVGEANSNAPPIQTLKKRADFVRIGKLGKRFACPYFVVVCAKNPLKNPAELHHHQTRVGYTVSKKVSKKAVVRNRIKRRLREAANIAFTQDSRQGYDYVIIARHSSESAAFNDLTQRLQFALKWLHKHAQTPKK